MAQIRINTSSRTKEKPYMINSQYLPNWEGKKEKKKKKKKPIGR